ncbi:MAG: deaminase [Thermodesulfobacteriota bacterium]
MTHETFMAMALAEAESALAAGEFPVGCVLVHATGQVVARGRRLGSMRADELDHAEMRAIRQLLTDWPEMDRRTLTAYTTMEPCLMCLAALLLNGIQAIVYAYEDVWGGGTDLPLATLRPLYQGMTLRFRAGVCRAESLSLFARFFATPENRYWAGSPLAQYTLAQARAMSLLP